MIFSGEDGTTAKPEPTPEPGLCTFEDDFCDWTKSGPDSHKWVRETGKDVANSGGEIFGPTEDHDGNNKTMFALNSVDPRAGEGPGQVAALRRIFAPGKWCVHFWYVMDLKNFGMGTIFEAISEKDGQNADVWVMTEADIEELSSKKWKEGQFSVIVEEGTELYASRLEKKYCGDDSKETNGNLNLYNI